MRFRHEYSWKWGKGPENWTKRVYRNERLVIRRHEQSSFTNTKCQASLDSLLSMRACAPQFRFDTQTVFICCDYLTDTLVMYISFSMLSIAVHPFYRTIRIRQVREGFGSIWWIRIGLCRKKEFCTCMEWKSGTTDRCTHGLDYCAKHSDNRHYKCEARQNTHPHTHPSVPPPDPEVNPRTV